MEGGLRVETAAKPSWLKKKMPNQQAAVKMAEIIDLHKLNTVCQHARCPNAGECYGKGTAAILILGDICTRNCAFCAVRGGRPQEPDLLEPERVAQAINELNLSYVVITSVTRDDLPFGGSHQYAKTIKAIKSKSPEIKVEVLTPDFQGNREAVEVVLEAGPNVFAHNIETVPSLYSIVRPKADYIRSLSLLKHVKEKAPAMIVKSGIMLGFGEKEEDVLKALRDLRGYGCDMVTLGQYLRPEGGLLPVKEYVPPERFSYFAEKAKEMGFKQVASAPFVRSSYEASFTFQEALEKEERR